MQPTIDTSRKMNGQLNPSTKESSDVMGKTFGALETASSDFGRQAGNMVSRISETSKNYYKTSEDYVKSHPVKGVAIAAGAGLLVGGLLSAALRRK